MVEIPILEIVLSRPLPIALTIRCSASSRSRSSGSSERSASSSRDSNIRYGLIAAGAVADQRRHVVDVARLAGLDHQTGAQARAGAHEVVVDRGDRQQRRHRHPLGPEVAVRQDQDVGAVVDVAGRPPRTARRAAAPSRSGPSSIGQVMSSVAASKISWETWRSFSSSWLRRIGWAITSWWACSGVSASRLTSAPTPGLQAHHHALADRVDRRVGDLREQLLEVGEQRRLAVGQHRQRGVVAHARHRLLALGGHRRDDHPQVLLRVAEGQLLGAQRLDPGRARLALGQVVDVPRPSARTTRRRACGGRRGA